ncbi:MAG: hypothetical protein QXN55_01555 [Candidatus Nitrosotenuis sp.]
MGHLFPIGYKSIRNILSSSPVSGLEDWRPSNSTIAVQAPLTAKTVSLYSGIGSVAIAVKDINGDTLDVEFSILKNNSQDYQDYTFEMPLSFSMISGQDSSIPRKNLLFKPTDSLQVFVNEIEFTEDEPGPTGFIRIDNNIIKFNVEQPPASIVKVAAFSAVELNTVTLRLVRVSGLNYEGNAWGNIDNFQYDSNKYYVYATKDLSALPVNSTLKIFPGNSAKVNVGSGHAVIPVEDMFFLIADEPYSRVDRNMRQFVRLENLGTARDFQIDYKQTSNDGLQLTCQAEIINSILPIFFALRIIDVNFELDVPTTVGVTSIASHPNIIGPQK